jgi:hypothetical protein
VVLARAVLIKLKVQQQEIAKSEAFCEGEACLQQLFQFLKCSAVTELRAFFMAQAKSNGDAQPPETRLSFNGKCLTYPPEQLK